MTYREIQKRAKELGLKGTGVKKVDLIRSIQTAEGNRPCFADGRESCDQHACCWRKECIEV